MQCNCEAWKFSMHQIIGAQGLASNHGSFYVGDAFKYCPWCGEKLKETEKKPKL